MKLIFNLTPRFNIDYNLNDFIYGIKSTILKNDLDFTQLESVFDTNNIFFTNSGRSSLYIILKALNLPKYSKIGVPLYSCTVVFDAIIKAGHVPYFIDIDLDNYTLDPCDLENKIEDISAVIVIHTFGRPADMDRIKQVVGNRPIIEDCAHSLFSKYKGKQTGTFGLVSFFSLKKYLSNYGGGMIILNNDFFANRIKAEVEVLKSFKPIVEISNVFVKYIYSSLYHKPWYGLFSPLGFYLRSKIPQKHDINDFTVKEIRKSDISLSLKKLNAFKEKVETQRLNSTFLLRELKDTSLVLPNEMNDTYCNYYLFPVRFYNKNERDTAHNYLLEMGIDTAKLYSETPMQAKEFYGYGGDCQNSETVADTVLTIPNYYALHENKIIEIANCIKTVERLL